MKALVHTIDSTQVRPLVPSAAWRGLCTNGPSWKRSDRW